MKKITFTLSLLALPIALTGCLDRFDYHGADPRAYHEEIYPKVNKVEFNSIYQSFYLTPDGSAFVPESRVAFPEFVQHVYPTAVERLVIASAYPNDERLTFVTRQLRGLGFKKKVMEYKTDTSLLPEEVVVQFDYHYVITPDCPDWRKASDINYSNTIMSQMLCATATNLGRQVANPKHLIQSDSLHVVPDGTVGARAIDTYHTGGTAATSSNSAADGADAAADSGETETGESAPAQ